MAGQYGRDVIEVVRPINITAEAEALAEYQNAYEGTVAYIDEKIVWYRSFGTNVLDIMMPERSLTAVFSLNAGLMMGGIFDFYTAFVGSLALVATYGAGAVYNNIKDIEADRINSASRPLASGALSVNFAWSLMALLALGGISLALLASPILAAACIIEVFLGIVYSKYTKAMGVLAYATLVTTHMATPLIAGALISGGFGVQTIVVALFLYATEVLAVSIKDYKDVEGDRKTGLRTLPIIYGPQKASKLTFIGLCLPLLLVWVPWMLFRLSLVFLGLYLVIGSARYLTGRKILQDQSPKGAGEALNSFRMITTLEMIVWCLA